MGLTDLLWVVPALPLLGFVALALRSGKLTDQAVARIGVGSVALAAALGLLLVAFGQGSTQTWTWLRVGEWTVRMGLALDPLSSCFVLVITGVGALIHLFATDYMRGDPGYARFFAYMNLFVAAMLTLVLADDLLLLYLGWEGVGLCSYLLIGFWYADPANGAAARKAFVVTRVGDAALAIALFLLVTRLGTLHLADLLVAAPATWAVGAPVATAVALLLLGGAVGKSAQVPLQVWLPDAMAGPTPVSALIHAATMVTAGVYLVARTHPLFELAPAAMAAVAVVGAVTLLVGGFSALFQRDLKRVLAYSTMSQIGYMFLALGVGAYGAAVYHFVTHALFKALLFLGAGAVILAMHHEQDMFAMGGGLRKKLPITFATFLVGALGLAGVPLVTGGFYSKEAILGGVAGSSMVLWTVGVLGAFVTALYTTRMVVLVFFGRPEPESEHEVEVERQVTPASNGTLIALAAGSVLAAGLGLPEFLGGFQPLAAFLDPVLPAEVHHGPLGEGAMAIVVSLVSLGGVALGWWMYAQPPPKLLELREQPADQKVSAFALSGLGFDVVYDRVFVRPLTALGILNRGDVVDRVFEGTATGAAAASHELARSQSGRLRDYLVVTVAGAVLLVALAIGGLL